MRQHLKLVLIILVGLAIGLGSPAFAQKKKKTYALDQRLYKVLEQVNVAIDEERDQDALDLMAGAESRYTRLEPYDYAQMNYMRGSIYYKLEDEDKALEAFTKVMDAEGQMPEYMEQQVLKTLMQLNLVRENYPEAKLYGEKMIAGLEKPKSDDYALLAQVYYKMKEFEDALTAAIKSRELYVADGKVPKENLLLLQNATYFEMKRMEDMIEVLNTLLVNYPKPTYVLYLASIYGQLDELQKQLILMEGLYDADLLDEQSQFVNLASLYLSERVPYKAAVLLDKHIKDGSVEGTKRNYEMLAQAWRLAAETDDALVAMGQAASLSDDGVLYLRKAYMHYDSAQWSETESAVNMALDKGLEGDMQGEAYLLLGMTQFSMNRFDDAIAACIKARDFDKSENLAKRWITYISREQDKYEALQNYN